MKHNERARVHFETENGVKLDSTTFPDRVYGMYKCGIDD